MGGWFSRTQATTALKNANTAVLRNALAKYIVAIKNTPNANQARQIMNANGNFLNANGKPVSAAYKNRIANGIAAAAFKAKASVKAAQEGEIPEGKAAEVVNNAAAKLKNLNQFMNNHGWNGTLNPALVRGYLSRYNRTNVNENHRTSNAARAGGARYGAFFNSFNQVKLNNRMNKLSSNIFKNTGVQVTSEQLANKYIQLYKENLNRNRSTNKNGKYMRIWTIVNGKISPQQPPVNTNAKARAAINRLWNLAGTGQNSNKNNKIQAAIVQAKVQKVGRQLNLNGLNRAQLNAILAANNFKPSTNANGANKNRHVARVKKILNGLYATN
jgi:hypothetical protein